MSGAVAALLPDGERLHLQHGPIDLIIAADGDRRTAFRAAAVRFATVLQELVAELPLLRRPVGAEPSGRIARRMADAVRPYGAQTFVTPMAAVAGAVAEEVLAAMRAATPLARAHVNNGGDIALHLAPGTSYRLAVASPQGRALGVVTISAADPVRGVATSGQGGRSFSFGIADAVTVLAATAAAADVAATLIANQVTLPGHAAIRRAPANELQPDTDLGSRLIVTHVGPLAAEEVALALENGVTAARAMLAQGRIVAAGLWLRGQSRTVGDCSGLTGEILAHCLEQDEH